jgi:hypothetical protein
MVHLDNNVFTIQNLPGIVLSPVVTPIFENIQVVYFKANCTNRAYKKNCTGSPVVTHSHREIWCHILSFVKVKQIVNEFESIVLEPFTCKFGFYNLISAILYYVDVLLFLLEFRIQLFKHNWSAICKLLQTSCHKVVTYGLWLGTEITAEPLQGN